MALEDWLRLIPTAKIIAFDTETTGLNVYDGTDSILGFSIAFNTDLGIVADYFPVAHVSGPNLENEHWHRILSEVVKKPLIMHNAVFDTTVLANLGFHVERFYDTMKLDHLINENKFSYSLDDTTERWLGYRGKEKSAMFTAGLFAYGWAGMPSGLMYDYAKADASITLQAMGAMSKSPEFTKGLVKSWQDIEGPTIGLLAKMRQRGVRINTPVCKEEETKGNKRMKEILDEFGTNTVGPKFLTEVFHKQLGLPEIRNKKGKITFDKDAMKRYELMLERKAGDNPVANRVLEYRGWQKSVSGYYLPYQRFVSKDGRLRAEYKPHGTVTGRFSCANPNLQQIPKETTKEWNNRVKGCLIGGDGFRLWELDYSQLEFRLAASASKEERLLSVFNDGSRDIFTEMASHLGMERQATKTLTYSIQYGAGKQRIQDVFGVTEYEAEDIIENFYAQYPMLRKASSYFSRQAKSKGHVEIWSGRRRHFANPQKEYYKAFNSFIQGGAADIVKKVMVDCYREVDNDEECRLLLQVHDSLVWEIKEGREEYYLPRIAEVMTRPSEDFGVKLDVDAHAWSK